LVAFDKSITKREQDILCFINDFWFCEISHVEKRFNIKKPRCYQILQSLVKNGLLMHRRIFHGRHGIYSVTAIGAKYTNLPALKNIPIAHYNHHLMVINVYLVLQKKYPTAMWMSERYLIRNNQNHRNKKKHLADGELIFTPNKRVAIEVELTLKGKDRVDNILKRYATRDDVDEVWYFCPNTILSILKHLIIKWPFVRVHSLDEFLS